MTLATLARFFIGDRQAILDIASNRSALWIGLLFVFSAAFAREYDGEYLMREPWHLLIPLAASLTSSILLFLIAVVRSVPDRRPTAYGSEYRSFLTLFWMTAPLAWLYAIPYERFLSAPDSISANLWTLRLVSLYRVILMSRVVSVITGVNLVASFFQVMAFADVVALVTVAFVPLPIIAVMGGIRLSESEQVINSATFAVWFLGILTLPIWILGTLISWAETKSQWQAPPATGGSTSRNVWALAVGVNLIWAPVLPVTQGEQQRRWQAEHTLKSGRIAEALDFMSGHSPSDFPPHWDPPPHRVAVEHAPHILSVMEELTRREVAPWVRAIYLEKFRQFLGEEYSFFWNREDADLIRLAKVLRDLPEGRDIVSLYRDEIKRVVDGPNHHYSADTRASLKALLDPPDEK